MIQLKDKVNKAAIMRELKAIADERYENAWEADLRKEEFINGAEALFKLLRLKPKCFTTIN